MRRFYQSFQYIFILIVVLIALIFADIMILSAIAIYINKGEEPLLARDIAEQLIEDEYGYHLDQSILDQLEERNTFAMLIDEAGDVIWSYHMPEELPVYYSRSDIASFTRWYLMDYPVKVWILEDKIFLLGQPKASHWKMQIDYKMDMLESIFMILPGLLTANVAMIFFLPLYIGKRSMKKRERSRTEWIAGVSHDIRTPLALVLGNASTIKEESSENNIKMKARIIEEQAIRIRMLIANLNTENKLSFGLGKWSYEEILLPALLRDILCQIMNNEESAPYDFEMELDGDTEQLCIKGDRELVRRMLENLIFNSMRHNPNGCKIGVTLHRMPKGAWKKWELAIKDDGIGVTEAQLMELNRRLKKEQLPEHGLGIRLVKQIAGMYRWKVRFEHSGERGLTCVISG